jgi:hypothetical protein
MNYDINGNERRENTGMEEERTALSQGVQMVKQTGIFYVKVKSNLKKAFQDFFPHMSENYIRMANLFNKEKLYPVLAVEKVTVFTKDGDETESARFLVPTENNNFLWIQSELFMFAGLEEPAGN